MDDLSLAALLHQHGVDVHSLSRFCLTSMGAIYTLTLEDTDVLDVWRTLRNISEVTGYQPVLSQPLATLGYDGPAIQNIVAYLQSDAVGQIIAAAEKIDPIAWLDERLAIDAKNAEENGDNVEEYRKELEGSWPADAEPRSWFTITDAKSLELHLVPTTVPWHVPAFYRFGGTNIPRPEEHVALLRYWFENYEAEMLGYRGDLIELYVHRPPRSRDEALTLAWQHYGYCPDVIVQGTGSIAALAATLLRGTAWYFWWD